MKKTFLILGALLFVLVVVFVFVDFRAARSTARTEHQVTTTSMGDVLPETMINPSVFKLTVTGDRFLAPALQDELEAALNDMGRFMDIEVSPAIATDAGGPYLVVQVTEKKMFWTPFYATSTVNVKTAFGSNGIVGAVLNDETIAYSSVNGPALHSGGEFTLNDRSFGVMTYPGYHSLVASELAKRIGDAVGGLYQAK